MAQSILDILIRLSKQGSADQDAIVSLKGVKTAAMDAMVVFGSLAAAGYAVDKVYQATAGTFITYGNEVAHVQELSGMTAEDSSRLINITQSLGLDVNNLGMAFRYMAKEGIDPSITGLEELSTRYNALSTPVERDNFLVKEFGRSGQDLAQMMSLGAAGIDQLNSKVADSNILDQQAVDKAKDLAIQTNQLSESWHGLTVEIGQAVAVPTGGLADIINGITGAFKGNEQMDLASQLQKDATGFYATGEAAKQYRVEAMNIIAAENDPTMNQWDESVRNLGAAFDTATAAEQANYDITQNVLDDAAKLTKDTTDYNTKLDDLNVKLDAATKKYGATSTQVQDLKGQIKALGDQQDATTVQWVLDVMKQNGASVEVQEAYEKANGLITQGAIDEANAIKGVTLAQAAHNLTADQAATLTEKIAAGFQNAGNNGPLYAQALSELQKDLDTGKLTATGYYQAVSTITDNVMALNGMQAYAYIHIVTIGGIPNLNQAGGPTWTPGHNVEQPGISPSYAAGGMLNLGGWSLVGDQPGGIPTPYSELISPGGVVIPANLTRLLLATGAVGFSSLSFGSGNGGGSGGTIGISGGSFGGGSNQPDPIYHKPNKGGGTKKSGGGGDDSSEAIAPLVQATQDTASTVAQLVLNANMASAAQISSAKQNSQETNGILQNVYNEIHKLNGNMASSIKSAMQQVLAGK